MGMNPIDNSVGFPGKTNHNTKRAVFILISYRGVQFVDPQTQVKNGWSFVHFETQQFDLTVNWAKKIAKIIAKKLKIPRKMRKMAISQFWTLFIQFFGNLNLIFLIKKFIFNLKINFFFRKLKKNSYTNANLKN